MVYYVIFKCSVNIILCFCRGHLGILGPAACSLHSSSISYGSLDDEFSKAKDRLNTLTEDPGNQAKLQLYALFKQVHVIIAKAWLYLFCGNIHVFRQIIFILYKQYMLEVHVLIMCL